MRTAALAVTTLVASITTCFPQPAMATPTLVELFTSEGCNSCPQAEAYFNELANGVQPPGDENILIAWHVDYWDYLGWKDPYGLALASQRQRNYATAMQKRGGSEAGRPGVYTPQIIVAGRRAFVGSDRRTGAFALTPRQRGGSQPLAIKIASDDDRFTITTNLPDLPAGAVVMGVLVEDGLASSVTAGENRGRTLKHERVARAAANGEIVNGTATIRLTVPGGVMRENASVVVFAQAPDMGPILAVGTTPLTSEPTQDQRYHTLAIGNQEIRYALILPDGFDPAKTYPAMLALPPGAQDERMVEAGLGRYWEQAAKERGWIVVSPINPDFARFFQARSDPLDALIQDISTRFNIEGNKFHVTGISNGGRAAFLAALEHPERFASLTVLPGMLGERTPGRKILGLRDLPITMYVGGDDTDWVRAAERSLEDLQKQGLSATLTILDGQGHGLSLAPKAIFDRLDTFRP